MISIGKESFHFVCFLSCEIKVYLDIKAILIRKVQSFQYAAGPDIFDSDQEIPTLFDHMSKIIV